MAITITPKYKPFTYEELVKPLEGYWKDYDKAEEDLTAARADIAKLDSFVDTLPDIEGNREYINQIKKYKNDLQSAVDDMTKNGLTADNRNKLKNLKSQQNSQIFPIITAIEAKNKDDNSKLAQKNQGIIFGKGETTTLNDYYGMNTPNETYSTSIKDIDALTGSITSTVVKDLQPQYSKAIVEALSNYNLLKSSQGISAVDFLTNQTTSNPAATQIINKIKERVLDTVAKDLGYTNIDSLDATKKNQINQIISNSILTHLQQSTNLTNLGGSKSSSSTNSGGENGSGRTFVAYRYLPSTPEWDATETGKKAKSAPSGNVTAGNVTAGSGTGLSLHMNFVEQAQNNSTNNSGGKPVNFYRHTLQTHYGGADIFNEILKGAQNKNNADAPEFAKIVNYYNYLEEGASIPVYKTSGAPLYIAETLPGIEKDKDGNVKIKRDKKGKVIYENILIYLQKEYDKDEDDNNNGDVSPEVQERLEKAAKKK